MKFTVEIASMPHREEVLAEIWLGDEMVAEVFKDSARNVKIEIYASSSGSPWILDLDSWTSALEEAKQRLGTT